MVWDFTLLFVGLLIGITVGMLITRKRIKVEEIHGILNVDCTDPADGAYLYLQLTVPIAEVADRKRVMFDVNVISNDSQK